MRIYLDNAATTKPMLLDALQNHIDGAWYNPSAAYAPAANVFIEMKQTRQRLTGLLSMNADVIFTSGGTEANNMAILAAYKKGAHYITSAIEHPSVYETFKHLEELGAEVDYVSPKGFCIRPQDVVALVRDNTAFVSIMHVNNETGARNDVGAIADAVKARNIKTRFHADGVQALFKTPINLAGSRIDYYTVSAHKINALKGTGALLVSKDALMEKLHFGGEQEYSLRPGTENTLGIQFFDEALQRGKDAFDNSLKVVTALNRRLTGGLKSIDGAVVNTPDAAVPHIVNVSFDGIRAEVLVRVLGEKGIYIGTGAACSRGKISRVLLASGIKRSLAEGSVRISMSALNTTDDIELCLDEIKTSVQQLRRFNRK